MKKRCFWAMNSMVCRVVLTGIVLSGASVWAQERSPRTGWDDKEAAEERSPNVAGDLQALYDRSAQANTVMELNSIIEGCRGIAKDTTRPDAERSYAKKLLSWSANRRGEMRTDMAGQMVESQQMEEAAKLDRAAAADFQLAIEYDPTRWRAFHNLGIAQAMNEELELAIGSFTRALELQPKFADAYFNRAEIKLRLSDSKEALEDYSKAIELQPDDPGMLAARARLRQAQGDVEGALADFQETFRLDPESGDAASAVADAFQSLGRWKEAAEAYQKAMQLSPDDPRTLQNAAWMMATCPDEYYRNPEASLKTAQRAVEASGNQVTVHRLHVLGVSQAATGDFAAAVKTLNEAIQITSDPTLRREIAQHRALFQKKKPYVQPGS